MAVTHEAEVVTLGPDLIFAQAETTQEEVELIQRWVADQVEMMIASSQRVRTLPLCTDFEGRLSRSGHEVGQLNILLDGMLSSQPSQRINLNIQGPRGLATSGFGSPNNSYRLFQNIEWTRRVTLARIEYSLS